MRVLFLLLLLANVLFLAWTRWVVPVAPATMDAPAPGGRKLQPIRLRAESPNAPATADDPSDADLLAASCVSVGPFFDPDHAAAVNAQLERLGFTSRRRVAQDEVRVGYWVRVPNLATPADATNALATLKVAGLADAYVLADGEPDNTVSVGVYADPRRAAEVAALVQKAGFTPETSDRVRTLEVLWLDIDRQANGGLPSLESLGTPPEGGLPYDMRACPAPRPDGDVTSPANRAIVPAGASGAG
ncbi:MAG: SPOR domain-containing protein [Gammaproteobacteria bacterium]|nr:SPOR domain-containing protein [Gammaproteobacteria bacterium]